MAAKKTKPKNRKKAAKNAWDARRKKHGKTGISKAIRDERKKEAKKRAG